MVRMTVNLWWTGATVPGRFESSLVEAHNNKVVFRFGTKKACVNGLNQVAYVNIHYFHLESPSVARSMKDRRVTGPVHNAM